MNMNIKNNEDLIFSLDIGTRTIIGLVCKINHIGELEVVDYAVREHEQRNMYDGQIHDISGVAEVVKELVDELENKIGMELKIVSVAAAGRALKTEKAIFQQSIDDSRQITDFDISTLEIGALQKAQDLISNGRDNVTEYYNIGYSVMEYYLDESPIENLKGHRGNNIGVEILATFLPKIVIEGLYSVIEEVGLTIGSITLEPIAAINVSIEKDLRILNLVLVDIGAGTSDIAITKEGQIIYYGMTQMAGDEITEALIRDYLIDFNTAEKLKRDILKKDEHTVKNILANEENISSSRILDGLDKTLNMIAEDIGENILKHNNKKPDAMFLIGGSSQMPLLKEKIAEKVGITEDRISIRDLSNVKGIKNLDKINKPDMVTPLGIAVEGLENKHRNFLNIKFNGEEIQLFNTGNIKVSDILVLTNFEPKKLIPAWSEDLIYYKNGNRRIKKGKEGTRPKILINGEESNLQDILKNGDELVITESQVEESEPFKLVDALALDTDLENVLVNGEKVDENYIIKQEDRIEILKKSVPNELKKESSDENDMKDLYEKTDDVNNKEEEILENVLTETLKNAEDEMKKLEEKEKINKIYLEINGEGKNIEYKEDVFRFVDIFDHIDFDRTQVKGKLCLNVNGEQAQYLQTLKDGDKIEVYWD